MRRGENVPLDPRLNVTVMWWSALPHRYVIVPVESSGVELNTS